MDIHSVVIHELKKKQNKMGAEVFLTDEELSAADERIRNIVLSLDQSFSKKTIRRAKFLDDGFKTVITDFKEIAMVQSSRDLTEKLKEQITNIAPARGGYLVFTKYKSTREFLSVFLVRNTTGSLLKQANGNSWDVESTRYLDVDHFAMGVRINLDTLNSDSEDRYIHLVRGNTDISSYFENWVGIDNKKAEAKDGAVLYDIANNINLPEGDTDRVAFKKRIYDFAKGKSYNIVNLRELSEFLYNDAEAIPKYCSDNQLDIDGEFRLSGNQLKKFYRISVSAGGIKLEADRDKFSDTGIGVSEDGKIVVIHSEDLAKAISESIEN